MRFRKDLPESGSGGNFLKLKDKESVTGIFRGDIFEFFAVWKDGKYHPVPEGTKGSKFRFRVNFVMKEGASYVPKIFEQGQTVYEQLSALHDEYGLESVIVKITRSGMDLDTTYQILPLRQAITPETEAVLKKLQLNDLSLKGGGGAAPGNDAPLPSDFDAPPEFMDNDEIPF